MQIRFDNGAEGAPVWFSTPVAEIVAREPEEVDAALAEIEVARKDGYWLAGYASYELGYVFEPRLQARLSKERKLPLLRFGIYDAPSEAAPLSAGGNIRSFEPEWDAERYSEAFHTVHRLIGGGDIYQANLTFPLTAACSGTSEALYAQLSADQPVGYGTLILQDDGPDILSRSPELFFRTDAAWGIETRPMKGTQPRSSNADEDARRRAFLRSDEKNRAENLMIVDLLRNDISRVAQPGSVHVPELFKVESFATVHQMVSTVAATLRADVGLGDILRALFPCGSITGAPKLRAMEVLNDLEPAPREIYCGSIGWAAPDGRSEFNVAIRTLMVENGQATLNVGGGVVWDSTAEAEYEEALWKTRFANKLAKTPS